MLLTVSEVTHVEVYTGEALVTTYLVLMCVSIFLRGLLFGKYLAYLTQIRHRNSARR